MSLVVALTACQKEEAPFAPDGANTQTITISIPQGMQSRAVGTYANAADYGKAVEINRCILQVYREGVAYGDPMVVGVQTSHVQPAPGGSAEIRFRVLGGLRY